MLSDSEWESTVEDLEDFESEDLEADWAADDEEAGQRGRNSYIGSMWDRYGFSDSRTTRADQAEALVTAHRMVQTFVSTFAGDTGYRVTFDPGMTTAGTDLVGKRVVISPGPVFDKTLTPVEAGLVLTGMAVHEASHARYGRATHFAAVKVFGKKRAPLILSNVLDDVRIEHRYAAEYPGYADVFRPMAEYVGRPYKSEGVVPKLTDQVNLMILALRYETSVDWPTPDVVAQREWWKAWGARWAKEDAPRRHVEAVREGLRHMAEVRETIKLQREQAAAKGQKPPQYIDPKSLALRDSLFGLNDMQKKAIRMASQGKTGPEIAATLGMSPDNARALLRNARTALAISARGGAWR